MAGHLVVFVLLCFVFHFAAGWNQADHLANIILTKDGGGSAKSGSSTEFQVTLRNADSNTTHGGGYRPFVDLSFDGRYPGDVTNLLSVNVDQYLQFNETVIEINRNPSEYRMHITRYPDGNRGEITCANHPVITGDVCGPQGGYCVTVQLTNYDTYPGFTSHNGTLSVTIDATMVLISYNPWDPLPPVPVYMRGGYAYGTDPANNAGSDPVIFPAGNYDDTDSRAWPAFVNFYPFLSLVSCESSNNARQGQDYGFPASCSIEWGDDMAAVKFQNVRLIATLGEVLTYGGLTIVEPVQDEIIHVPAVGSASVLNESRVALKWNSKPPGRGQTTEVEFEVWFDEFDAHGNFVTDRQTGFSNMTTLAISFMYDLNITVVMSDNSIMYNISTVYFNSSYDLDTFAFKEDFFVFAEEQSVHGTSPGDIMRARHRMQLAQYVRLGNVEWVGSLSDGNRIDIERLPQLTSVDFGTHVFTIGEDFLIDETRIDDECVRLCDINDTTDGTQVFTAKLPNSYGLLEGVQEFGDIEFEVWVIVQHNYTDRYNPQNNSLVMQNDAMMMEVKASFDWWNNTAYALRLEFDTEIYHLDFGDDAGFVEYLVRWIPVDDAHADISQIIDFHSDMNNVTNITTVEFAFQNAVVITDDEFYDHLKKNTTQEAFGYHHVNRTDDQVIVLQYTSDNFQNRSGGETGLWNAIGLLEIDGIRVNMSTQILEWTVMNVTAFTSDSIINTTSQLNSTTNVTTIVNNTIWNNVTVDLNITIVTFKFAVSIHEEDIITMAEFFAAIDTNHGVNYLNYLSLYYVTGPDEKANGSRAIMPGDDYEYSIVGVDDMPLTYSVYANNTDVCFPNCTDFDDVHIDITESVTVYIETILPLGLAKNLEIELDLGAPHIGPTAYHPSNLPNATLPGDLYGVHAGPNNDARMPVPEFYYASYGRFRLNYGDVFINDFNGTTVNAVARIWQQPFPQLDQSEHAIILRVYEGREQALKAFRLERVRIDMPLLAMEIKVVAVEHLGEVYHNPDLDVISPEATDYVTFEMTVMNIGHAPAYNVSVGASVSDYMRLPRAGISFTPQNDTRWSGDDSLIYDEDVAVDGIQLLTPAVIYMGENVTLRYTLQVNTNVFSRSIVGISTHVLNYATAPDGHNFVNHYTMNNYNGHDESIYFTTKSSQEVTFLSVEKAVAFQEGVSNTSVVPGDMISGTLQLALARGKGYLEMEVFSPGLDFFFSNITYAAVNATFDEQPNTVLLGQTMNITQGNSGLHDSMHFDFGLMWYGGTVNFSNTIDIDFKAYVTDNTTLLSVDDPTQPFLLTAAVTAIHPRVAAWKNTDESELEFTVLEPVLIGEPMWLNNTSNAPVDANDTDVLVFNISHAVQSGYRAHNVSVTINLEGMPLKLNGDPSVSTSLSRNQSITSELLSITASLDILSLNDTFIVQVPVMWGWVHPGADFNIIAQVTYWSSPIEVVDKGKIGRLYTQDFIMAVTTAQLTVSPLPLRSSVSETPMGNITLGERIWLEDIMTFPEVIANNTYLYIDVQASVSTDCSIFDVMSVTVEIGANLLNVPADGNYVLGDRRFIIGYDDYIEFRLGEVRNPALSSLGPAALFPDNTFKSSVELLVYRGDAGTECDVSIEAETEDTIFSTYVRQFRLVAPHLIMSQPVLNATNVVAGTFVSMTVVLSNDGSSPAVNTLVNVTHHAKLEPVDVVVNTLNNTVLSELSKDVAMLHFHDTIDAATSVEVVLTFRVADHSVSDETMSVTTVEVLYWNMNRTVTEAVMYDVANNDPGVNDAVMQVWNAGAFGFVVPIFNVSSSSLGRDITTNPETVVGETLTMTTTVRFQDGLTKTPSFRLIVPNNFAVMSADVQAIGAHLNFTDPDIVIVLSDPHSLGRGDRLIDVTFPNAVMNTPDRLVDENDDVTLAVLYLVEYANISRVMNEFTSSHTDGILGVVDAMTETPLLVGRPEVDYALELEGTPVKVLAGDVLHYEGHVATNFKHAFNMKISLSWHPNVDLMNTNGHTVNISALDPAYNNVTVNEYADSLQIYLSVLEPLGGDPAFMNLSIEFDLYVSIRASLGDFFDPLMTIRWDSSPDNVQGNTGEQQLISDRPATSTEMSGTHGVSNEILVLNTSFPDVLTSGSNVAVGEKVTLQYNISINEATSPLVQMHFWTPKCFTILDAQIVKVGSKLNISEISYIRAMNTTRGSSHVYFEFVNILNDIDQVLDFQDGVTFAVTYLAECSSDIVEEVSLSHALYYWMTSSVDTRNYTVQPVTIVKPLLDVSMLRTSPRGEALTHPGEVVNVTTWIKHADTSAAWAFDMEFDIAYSSSLTLLAMHTSQESSPSHTTGQNAINMFFPELGPSDVLQLNFSFRVPDTLKWGGNFFVNINGTYDSSPKNVSGNDGERTDAGVFTEHVSTYPVLPLVSAPNLTWTSLPQTPGSTVAVAELFTVEYTLTVPHGVTSCFNFVVEQPVGSTVSGQNATVTAFGVNLNTTHVMSTPYASISETITSHMHGFGTVEFDFGPLYNPPADGVVNEADQIVIELTYLAENDPTAMLNPTLTYCEAGGIADTRVVTRSDSPVQIALPSLQLTLSRVGDENGDVLSGDMLTYTGHIKHTHPLSPASFTPAFNLSLTFSHDDQLVFQSGLIVNSTGDIVVTSPEIITVTIAPVFLLLDDEIDVVLILLVNQTVTPLEQLSLSVDLAYYSAPTTYRGLSGEQLFAPTEQSLVVNSYSPNLAAKSPVLVDTSLSSSHGSEVVVGETWTVDYYVQFADGINPSNRLTLSQSSNHLLQSLEIILIGLNLQYEASDAVIDVSAGAVTFGTVRNVADASKNDTTDAMVVRAVYVCAVSTPTTIANTIDAELAYQYNEVFTTSVSRSDMLVETNTEPTLELQFTAERTTGMYANDTETFLANITNPGAISTAAAYNISLLCTHPASLVVSNTTVASPANIIQTDTSLFIEFQLSGAFVVNNSALVVTFDGSTSDHAQPVEEWTVLCLLSYDTSPNNISGVTGEQFSTSKDHTLVNDDVPLVLPPTVVSSSVAESSGIDVLVGENVTFSQQIQFSDGFVSHLVHNLTLPATMLIVRARVAAVGSFVAIDDSNTVFTFHDPVSFGASNQYSAYRSVLVDFTAIFNQPDHLKTEDDVVIIEVDAIVMNTRNTVDNIVSAFTFEGYDVIMHHERDEYAAVVQVLPLPEVLLSYGSNATFDVAAGSMMELTLNASTLTSETAYDLTLTLVLPPELVFMSMVQSGWVDNSTGQDIILSRDVLSGSSTIVLFVKMLSTVTVNQILNTQALIEYDSSPHDNTFNAGAIVSTPSNTLTIVTGGVALVLPSITSTRSVYYGSSEPWRDANELAEWTIAPFELYVVRVQFSIRGAMNDIRVVSYLNGNDLRCGFVSAEVSVGSALSTGDISFVEGDWKHADGITDRFTVQFGDVTNTGDDTSAAADFITVDFTLQITDPNAIVSGESFPWQNSWHEGGGTQIWFDDQAISLIRPTLAITSACEDDNCSVVRHVNAGDYTRWVVRFDHDGSTSPAYYANLSVILPPQMKLSSAPHSINTTAGVALATDDGSRLTVIVDVFDLNDGPVEVEFAAIMQINVQNFDQYKPTYFLDYYLFGNLSSNEGLGPRINAPAVSEDNFNMVRVEKVVRSGNSSLVAHSIDSTAGYDVAIGEVVQLSASMALLEGTVDGITVTVDVPEGLDWYEWSADWGSSVLSPPEGIRTDNVIQFGTVQNAGDNKAFNDIFNISFFVLVEDLSVNVDGVVSHMNVTLASSSGNNVTSQFALTIVEPALHLSVSQSISSGDAGDVVSLVLSIAQDVLASSDAYDLSIHQLFDDKYVFQEIQCSVECDWRFYASLQPGSLFPVVDALDVDIVRFPLADADIELTIHLALSDELEPGDVLDTWSFQLDYDSSPNNEGAGNTGRSASAFSTQDLSFTATHGVTFPVTFSATTSLDNTPGNRVSVGEHIIYSAAVHLDEGRFPADGVSPLLFNVSMIEQSQLSLVAVVINLGDSVSSSEFNNGDNATLVDGHMMFNLGTVVNAGDNVHDENDVIGVTLDFVVTDVAANRAGRAFDPQCTVSFTDIHGLTVSGVMESYRIIEPVIALVSLPTVDVLDAGDVVGFTTVFQHTSTSTGDALHVNFSDPLSAKLQLIPESTVLTVNNVGATLIVGDHSGDQVVVVNIPVLTNDSSSVVELYYEVRVSQAVQLGEILTSHPTLEWVSATDIEFGRRNRSEQVISLVSTGDVVLSHPVIVNTTKTYTAGSDMTVMEQATLQWNITLFEGTVPNVLWTVVVPDKLSYIDSRVKLGSNIFSERTPNVQHDNGTIVIDFGEIVNIYDNIVNVDDTIVIEFDIMLLQGDVTGRADVSPTFSLSYHESQYSHAGTATLTAVMPVLEVVATLDANDVYDAMDDVVVIVRISHMANSTADAEAVVVTLDDSHLELVSVSNADGVDLTQRTATVNMLALSNETIELIFHCHVSNAVTFADVLSGNVSVTYHNDIYSLFASTSDIVMNFTLPQLEMLPTLTSLKSSSDADVYIGETIFMSAAVTFPEGTQLGDDIHGTEIKVVYPHSNLQLLTSNILFGAQISSKSVSNGTIATATSSDTSVYSLGQIVNSGDNVLDAGDTFVVSFEFLIRDVSTNTRNSSNEVKFVFTDVQNNAMTVSNVFIVQEALLSLNVMSDAPEELVVGDVIHVETVLLHSGESTGSAYNVSVRLGLPLFLDVTNIVAGDTFINNYLLVATRDINYIMLDVSHLSLNQNDSTLNMFAFDAIVTERSHNEIFSFDLSHELIYLSAPISALEQREYRNVSFESYSLPYVRPVIIVTVQPNDDGSVAFDVPPTLDTSTCILVTIIDDDLNYLTVINGTQVSFHGPCGITYDYVYDMCDGTGRCEYNFSGQIFLPCPPPPAGVFQLGGVDAVVLGQVVGLSPLVQSSPVTFLISMLQGLSDHNFLNMELSEVYEEHVKSFQWLALRMPMIGTTNKMEYITAAGDGQSDSHDPYRRLLQTDENQDIEEEEDEQVNNTILLQNFKRRFFSTPTELMLAQIVWLVIVLCIVVALVMSVGCCVFPRLYTELMMSAGIVTMITFSGGVCTTAWLVLFTASGTDLIPALFSLVMVALFFIYLVKSQYWLTLQYHGRHKADPEWGRFYLPAGEAQKAQDNKLRALGLHDTISQALQDGITPGGRLRSLSLDMDVGPDDLAHLVRDDLRRLSMDSNPRSSLDGDMRRSSFAHRGSIGGGRRGSLTGSIGSPDNEGRRGSVELRANVGFDERRNGLPDMLRRAKSGEGAVNKTHRLRYSEEHLDHPMRETSSLQVFRFASGLFPYRDGFALWMLVMTYAWRSIVLGFMLAVAHSSAVAQTALAVFVYSVYLGALLKFMPYNSSYAMWCDTLYTSVSILCYFTLFCVAVVGGPPDESVMWFLIAVQWSAVVGLIAILCTRLYWFLQDLKKARYATSEQHWALHDSVVLEMITDVKTTVNWSNILHCGLPMTTEKKVECIAIPVVARGKWKGILALRNMWYTGFLPGELADGIPKELQENKEEDNKADISAPVMEEKFVMQSARVAEPELPEDAVDMQPSPLLAAASLKYPRSAVIAEVKRRKLSVVTEDPDNILFIHHDSTKLNKPPAVPNREKLPGMLSPETPRGLSTLSKSLKQLTRNLRGGTPKLPGMRVTTPGHRKMMRSMNSFLLSGSPTTPRSDDDSKALQPVIPDVLTPMGRELISPASKQIGESKFSFDAARKAQARLSTPVHRQVMKSMDSFLDSGPNSKVTTPMNHKLAALSSDLLSPSAQALISPRKQLTTTFTFSAASARNANEQYDSVELLRQKRDEEEQAAVRWQAQLEAEAKAIADEEEAARLAEEQRLAEIADAEARALAKVKAAEEARKAAARRLSVARKKQQAKEAKEAAEREAVLNERRAAIKRAAEARAKEKEEKERKIQLRKKLRMEAAKQAHIESVAQACAAAEARAFFAETEHAAKQHALENMTEEERVDYELRELDQQEAMHQRDLMELERQQQLRTIEAREAMHERELVQSEQHARRHSYAPVHEVSWRQHGGHARSASINSIPAVVNAERRGSISNLTAREQKDIWLAKNSANLDHLVAAQQEEHINDFGSIHGFGPGSIELPDSALAETDDSLDIRINDAKIANIDAMLAAHEADLMTIEHMQRRRSSSVEISELEKARLEHEMVVAQQQAQDAHLNAIDAQLQQYEAELAKIERRSSAVSNASRMKKARNAASVAKAFRRQSTNF